jgi:hypothetical protein
MIARYLTNTNNLIQYIIMFLILLLIIYLIYKICILETDVYILNDRISKFELQLNNTTIEKTNLNNEDIQIANNFMNEIFINQNQKHDDEEPSSIDIDEIINIKTDEKPSPNKEEIFDLKKDVMTTDDNQSIVSSTNITKKKLQKLNLDKLKEKCEELNISTEGTKANLVDRIIEEINKDV